MLRTFKDGRQSALALEAVLQVRLLRQEPLARQHQRSAQPQAARLAEPSGARPPLQVGC